MWLPLSERFIVRHMPTQLGSGDAFDPWCACSIMLYQNVTNNGGPFNFCRVFCNDRYCLCLQDSFLKYVAAVFRNDTAVFVTSICLVWDRYVPKPFHRPSCTMFDRSNSFHFFIFLECVRMQYYWLWHLDICPIVDISQ